MISQRELERVYTEHGGAVFAYLLNLSRSVSVSEDLLHELFLKLSQRSALAWKFVRQQRRYLLRSAYCLFVDYCRREKARALMVENAQQLRLFEPPDADGEADGQRVAEWLGSLPVEQRAVVHLKIWEQLTFREIAQQLNIPADTAASRYRYALDKLRDRQRRRRNGFFPSRRDAETRRFFQLNQTLRLCVSARGKSFCLQLWQRCGWSSARCTSPRPRSRRRTGRAFPTLNFNNSG